MGNRIWSAANGIVLMAFLFSIFVQFNDPDPFAWVAIYGLAAVANTLEFLHRGHWIFPGVIAVASGVWALTIAPGIVGAVPFLEMFAAWEMKSAGIEESREMYGLLIIVTWMSVLAIRGARLSRRAARSNDVNVR